MSDSYMVFLSRYFKLVSFLKKNSDRYTVAAENTSDRS